MQEYFRLVLCWEVCPLSECPLSEVSLYSKLVPANMLTTDNNIFSMDWTGLHLSVADS